jgi:hypothetical protein
MVPNMRVSSNDACFYGGILRFGRQLAYADSALPRSWETLAKHGNAAPPPCRPAQKILVIQSKY